MLKGDQLSKKITSLTFPETIVGCALQTFCQESSAVTYFILTHKDFSTQNQSFSINTVKKATQTPLVYIVVMRDIF